MTLDLGALLAAVREAAALRRRARMQPAAGPGAKVYPSTYADVGHLVDMRRSDGRDVACVVLDSVQSQARRLGNALAGCGLELPRVEVDFSGTKRADVGRITSLTAPHRVYDAILRDSE